MQGEHSDRFRSIGHGRLARFTLSSADERLDAEDVRRGRVRELGEYAAEREE